MSEWKKCRIGDLVTLRQGFAINAKSKHYISKERTSLALLRIADMKSGSREIFIREDIPQNFIARAEDIVYTRTGNVGLVFRNNYGVVHNNCFTVTPNDEKALSRDFLYYLLQSKYFFEKANSLARGAAQPDLPHSLFNSIEISYPELDCQHRIATILSRYDSLIENYQKQIKLLEEAAQRLYKEWFVDLHFPGYENTKIVDGVPEGWEKKNIGSLIDYEIGGGWGDETKVTPDHVTAYVIRGTDMNNIENGNLQSLPLRYHQSGNFNARQLQEYDIIFEVSGGSKTEGVAKTFLVFDKFLSQLDYPVICASFCKLIRLKNKEDACYVYDTFKEWRISGITSQYDKRSASSIVNYRWKDFLSQQEIKVPSENVLLRYTNISKKNHFMRVDLASQIRLLTEARDRLLPKLMSDEIEVGKE